MRQGNEFHQWIRHNEMTVTIPLEIMDDLERFDTMLWIDNRDGTYTLQPVKPKGYDP